MKRFTIGQRLSVLLIAASIAGCLNENRQTANSSQGPTGQIQLALSASGASGSEYRLRDAVFEIYNVDNDSMVSVSSEDDPSADRIDVSLATGTYGVFLEPGYRLVRVSEGGGNADAGDAEDAGVFDGLSTAADVDAWRNAYPARKMRFNENRDRNDRAALNAPAVGVSSRGIGPRDDVMEAELISENPVFAEVYTDETTAVNFAFRVNGDVVETGDGVLSIGITVEEASANCTDDYEPNDSFETAVSVDLSEEIEATSCDGNDDFYIFDPPVAQGEPFVVDILFSGASADIDAVLFDLDGNEVSYSGSVSDNEQVSAISDGRSYILYVIPFWVPASTPYTVAASAAEQNDCCTASTVPGCSDPDIQACVCDFDEWCCMYGFDEACISIAITECEAPCAVNDGDCCEESEEPGCEDAALLSCLCQVDMDCCFDSYDSFCVMEAKAECGLVCETAPPDSDCCAAGENPGCTDDGVEACVCGIDPFCCVESFDANCAGIAVDMCGADC